MLANGATTVAIYADPALSPSHKKVKTYNKTFRTLHSMLQKIV